MARPRKPKPEGMKPGAAKTALSAIKDIGPEKVFREALANINDASGASNFLSIVVCQKLAAHYLSLEKLTHTDREHMANILPHVMAGAGLMHDKMTAAKARDGYDSKIIEGRAVDLDDSLFDGLPVGNG